MTTSEDISAMIRQASSIIERNKAGISAAREVVASTQRFLRASADLIEVHGILVATRTVEHCWTFGYGSGETARELADVARRFGEERLSRGFYTIDPKAKFPVEISSTGRIEPARLLGLAS